MSPEQILGYMKVEPGVYVLGSLESRVTLYSQQTRALNLVYSLIQHGRLGFGSHVGVVGAGVAGLTAAAALLSRGIRVTLLESKPVPLHLLTEARHRWLHPSIYDWPDNEDPAPRHPILGWNAADGTQVRTEILREWDREFKVSPNLRFHCSVEDVKVQRPGGRLRLWWSSGQRAGPLDAVILAVGFGVERALEPASSLSYWQGDDLESFIPSHRSFFISGTGDGGLTDVLRTRLREFRHEELAELVSGSLGPNGFAKLRKKLREIDAEARHLSERAAQYGWVTEQYWDLRGLEWLIPLDLALQSRIRVDTHTTLHGLSEDPYGPGSAILNRFLVSRLVQLGAVKYVYGPMKFAQAENGYRVEVDRREMGAFDRVIIRHGVYPALQAGFPNYYEENADGLRRIAQIDATRQPIWPEGWWNSSLPILSIEGSPPSTGVSGSEPPPGAPPAPSVVPVEKALQAASILSPVEPKPTTNSQSDEPKAPPKMPLGNHGYGLGSDKFSDGGSAPATPKLPPTPIKAVAAPFPVPFEISPSPSAGDSGSEPATDALEVLGVVPVEIVLPAGSNSLVVELTPLAQEQTRDFQDGDGSREKPADVASPGVVPAGVEDPLGLSAIPGGGEVVGDEDSAPFTPQSPPTSSEIGTTPILAPTEINPLPPRPPDNSLFTTFGKLWSSLKPPTRKTGGSKPAEVDRLPVSFQSLPMPEHGHRAAAWSPDGTQVAVGCASGAVHLIEVETGKPLASLSTGRGPLNVLRWSPTGSLVAVGFADGTVRLWDPGVTASQVFLGSHGGSVNDLAWSPDGSKLVTGSEDGTIRLWDVASAKLVATSTGVWWGINAIAWVPDGGQVAAGTADGATCIGSPAGGAFQAIRRTEGISVTSLAIEPTTAVIACGGWDGRLCLVNHQTGELLPLALPGLNLPVWRIDFSCSHSLLAAQTTSETLVCNYLTGAPVLRVQHQFPQLSRLPLAFHPQELRLVIPGGVSQPEIRIVDLSGVAMAPDSQPS